MIIKTINLKNISDSAIIIGDYKIIKDECINIPLDKIDNIMWKNILALVNLRQLNYAVETIEIDDNKKEEVKEEKSVEEVKEEKQVKETKTTKKKTIKKTTEKETVAKAEKKTRKKKEKTE